MPQHKSLEMPQESLLESIKEELEAEAAEAPTEDIENLRRWRKVHAAATIGIYAAIICGVLLSIPLALINSNVIMIGIGISYLASSICSLASITITIIKPAIFIINTDGTKRSEKIARRNFLFFWLVEGLPAAAILLIGIVLLIGLAF